MKFICLKVKYICKIYGDISLSNSQFIHKLCNRIPDILCPAYIENSPVAPSITVAVMFTFSFGSAFAVQKADYNETLAKTYFDVAMKAIADSDDEGLYIGASGEDKTEGYFVEYATLASFYDQLFSAAVDYAKAEAGHEYVGNGKTINDFLYLVPTTGNEIDNSELKMDIVAAQYKADKETAIGNIDALDLSDYSSEKLEEVDADGCTTYLEHVQYIINEAKKEIEKATFTTDDGVAKYVEAKNTIDGFFGEYTKDNKDKDGNATLIAEKGYLGGTDGNTKIGLGVYELNTAFVVGTGTLNDYTTAAVKGKDATDTASVAAQKAAIAGEYARYMAQKDADKTFADNMKKALDFLAEEGIAVNANAAGPNFVYFVEGTNGANVSKIKAAITTVEQFEVDAARLAAEKDANGALVRDAEDVADLVTEGKIYAYIDGIDALEMPTVEKDGNQVAKYRSTAACLKAIENLYASLDDSKLEYEKKAREAYVANLLADAEKDETYYPAELAKVKSLTEEYLAKVNAITELDKVGKYDNEYFGASVIKLAQDIDKEDGTKVTSTSLIGKVDKATEIDEAAAALYTAAEQYADFVNNQIKKNDDRYYLGEKNTEGTNNYAKLHAAINELVGNSEARTAKEISALSDKALALVKELPTNATVDAALDAADDAIKALPKKVSTAAKDAIDAAKAAVKAYEDLSAAKYAQINRTNSDKLNETVLKYAYAFNNEMTAKVKAVSATDKEAVKALKAEIKDFIKAYEYDKTNKLVEGAFTLNLRTLNGYLASIQDADKAAVDKAIAAIPERSNITEADKATVEAARKAYDAYVAEYTDYEDPYDGYVADDFDYATLVKAEALLGLNQESPAKAVESLKITARSTAKKGSITVKWTVKGEADIDGYEIWKSTKANKGYKKAFTTTKKTYKNSKGLKKGTRYYYKVRAYKVIDGVKVTSDWSNKANRKAK